MDDTKLPNREHLVANSGKMRVLDKLLMHLKENESRVLIFAQEQYPLVIPGP